VAVSVLIGLGLLIGPGWGGWEQGNTRAQASRKPLSENDRQIGAHAQRMIDEGRQIFRFDTFGSEAFWGDALQLHKAIAGEKNGDCPDSIGIFSVSSANTDCAHLSLPVIRAGGIFFALSPVRSPS
jgi:hypothetical protein